MVNKASHSEVQSYLACERRHYYAYGYEIQGKYLSEALERGIIVHAVLAEYYTVQLNGGTVAEAEAAGFAMLTKMGAECQGYDSFKIMAQCSSLVFQYFNHYRDEGIEVLAVETEYLVPITDNYSLQVRIDLICRIGGQVIVRDHKVVQDFYDDNKAALDPQLPKYLAGLWSMSESPKIDKLEFNQIRHRNTEENKGDPGKRFLQKEVPVTRARVLGTLKEQLQVATRIASLRAKGLDEWGKTVVRNTGACGNCPFTAICIAENNNEDRETIDLLLQYEYRPKTKRAEMNS